MNDSSPQAYSRVLDQAVTSAPPPEVFDSKDGESAGDNDLPFAGFQASHFSTRQMVRLLFLRSNLLDAHLGQSPFRRRVAAS
jgi:hypothetical protein